MPKEEILSMVRNINPNEINWLNNSIERLSNHRFNTKRIIEGVPEECGVTTAAYLKSFLNWKTVSKCVSIGGPTIITALSPGLLAKYMPKVAQILNWPAIEQSTSVIRYSYNRWNSLLSPTTSSITTRPLLSIGQTLVIAKISQCVFEKLNECCGPKNFRAWKAEKMNIFIQSKEDLIPERHEDDRVLSANICPITNLPIRIPCRTKHSLFEESAIKSWLIQQGANNLQPNCPLTREPLTFQDLNIDYNLSDQIEIRLLLLNSK